MTFAGANHSYLPLLMSASIVPTGARVYLNTTSTSPGPVPLAWPSPATMPTFIIPSSPEIDYRYAVSIRPDVAKVCAGELDAELLAFLKSAPGGPCSLLALWHEAGTMAYPGLDNNLLKSAQLRIQAMCRSNSFNVKVGSIEVTGTPHLADWAARDLDFYGVDVYDDPQGTLDAATPLDGFAARADGLMAEDRRAVIAVTETNSRFPGERRATWLNEVSLWMERNGHTGNDTSFLTYWNPAGELSGPWHSDDTATINVLRSICARSST